MSLLIRRAWRFFAGGGELGGGDGGRGDAVVPPDADAPSHASSGDGDDGSEALLLQKLRVPDVPLPAIVWRDIRGEHEDDPMEYLRELDR